MYYGIKVLRVAAKTTHPFHVGLGIHIVDGISKFEHDGLAGKSLNKDLHAAWHHHRHRFLTLSPYLFQIEYSFIPVSRSI